MILHKVGEVHIFKHRLYISASEQARVLILGKESETQYINIVMLERFCEMQVKDQLFGSWALHVYRYLSFGTCYEANIMQLCSLGIHK